MLYNQINKFNYIFEKLDQSFILIFLHVLRENYTLLCHSMLYCNAINNYFTFYIIQIMSAHRRMK